LGQLTFPLGARVYFDTAPIIYTIEKHIDFWPVLKPFWLSVKEGEATAVTSELTLLETLVLPIRQNNKTLINEYETLLTKTDIVLSPITTDALRVAAKLRAEENLKTPDAIHAAAATASNCEYFVTNDDGFRRLTNIRVVVLSELL
jgi:predicted nucleic acid-binding protein